MKKVNVAELSGAALDWAVAKVMGFALQPSKTGLLVSNRDYFGCWGWTSFFPSSNWADGGPIIERERIWTAECSGAWSAKPALNFDKVERLDTWASTPLEAAMRCYVASKLGIEVDVPEALL